LSLLLQPHFPRSDLSRACCRLQNFLLAFQSLRPTAFRACSHFQTPQPPPELRTVPPPWPSTSSRVSDLLHGLRPSPELPTVSQAFGHFQPPPQISTTSRSSCRLQSFVLTASGAFEPPLEFPTASRASHRLKSFTILPREPSTSSIASCRLQSFTMLPRESSTSSRASCCAVSRAFDFFQRL
jgi:hypothetical protein